MAARPPLAAIFVFCSAARCGSFKLAAQELCVTPGAVSRQIQSLEDYLGEALFERQARSVALTATGRQLQDRVADKMASIGAEVDFLRSGGRKTVVRVDAGVTVAMHWLIPRLASFAARHADVQVQISTSDGPIDLGKRMDLYIRRDPSEFRGLEPVAFLDEHSVLVASPRLVKGATAFPLRSVGRMARIGARSRPDLWPQWAAHHGLAGPLFEPSLQFDNTVLAIQAAAEGLGVMVVPEMFVSGMIASQLLLVLDGTRVPTGAYSHVTRTRRDSVALRKFIDWLQGAS